MSYVVLRYCDIRINTEFELILQGGHISSCPVPRRSIVHLDETWVNARHTKQFVWQDKTVKSSQDAFVMGLTTGLAAPSGKEGRPILVHAENDSLPAI